MEGQRDQPPSRDPAANPTDDGNQTSDEAIVFLDAAGRNDLRDLFIQEKSLMHLRVVEVWRALPSGEAGLALDVHVHELLQTSFSVAFRLPVHRPVLELAAANGRFIAAAFEAQVFGRMSLAGALGVPRDELAEWLAPIEFDADSSVTAGA